MTSHTLLDSNTHRDLRICVDAGADLGDGVMATLVVPSEFRRVQADFPILFRRETGRELFFAVALLGFETGENLFLDGARWDGGYRPLSLAIQPFLIGRPPGGEGSGQVHIDLAHPRIAQDGDEGVRLFDSEGRPTPFLDAIADRLGELDEGYRGSGAFFDALAEHELLEPFTFEVMLDDGSLHSLVGFHIIDEARLRALDAAALGALHAAGHLMPIFMALASLSQLAELARRKNRRRRDG
ncbi:multidrug transporter [Sphingopyxis lindanitolerans]|uniref:Multidrug transporter n=1 Tax=Sphingopyxis lindanitolerans TaxID=2054227 RepID=A0A2S8B856_9SPHN|nr:SapC family protein [Sphingopyxis lindanitolerans]PQM28592.1 multidrug transporter [Sphingopyxis lindanitolerans]